MRHIKTYTNYYLRIKVNTNSKRIYKLIDHFLDFDNGYYPSDSQIKIEYYLDEMNSKKPEDKIFFHQGIIYENKEPLFFLANRIINLKANLKSGKVKGAIFDYQDSFKEDILGSIFIQPLYFILAHHGLFFLHASAVCKDKDCILIIGSQDSGKSTLALTLARNGFGILSDDKCFVKQVKNQQKLFFFPTKMGLTDKILNKHPELNKHILQDYKYGEKKRISYNSISHLNQTNGLRCKMIIFPRYEDKKNIYLKEIPREKAPDRLFRESPFFYAKKKLQKPFWTLYNLISQTKSFELRYNDARLDNISEVINKIFLTRDNFQ